MFHYFGLVEGGGTDAVDDGEVNVLLGDEGDGNSGGKGRHGQQNFLVGHGACSEEYQIRRTILGYRLQQNLLLSPQVTD
jgi:hypothetical protein